MSYVYVLHCKKNNKFYIGYTSNLQRRIKEHKAKKVCSTSRYPSFYLIFYEWFFSKEDAVKRECYFKTTKGKRSLRLILNNSLKAISCPVV